jgi:CRP-like cAMP-binding protein
MDDSTVAIAALQSIPFFAGLEREELEGILRVGQPASFESGEVIVERGDVGDAMYVVLRGTAQVEVGGRYHDLKPGDFFGEMAVIAGRKRMATVRAAEPVDALRISAEDFRAFVLQQPAVALTMLRSLVDRLREVQERLDAWIGVW